MSKISIEGNASGTGTLTIAAPNTNSNFTLDIPSASGVIDRLNRAGNVLQVVSASISTTFTTTSTSFVDVTGFTTSITPSSTSSNILVMVSSRLSNSSGSNPNNRGDVKIVRNSTDVATILIGAYLEGTGGTDLNNYHAASFVTLDSPSSTSSVTYKIQLSSRNASNTIRCEVPSTITLMEIAG